MHVSIPVPNTMEYINATQISPLISHCCVKVCYVGQEPNRNHTVITKELATEMGKKLPGSPVVGFYNKKEKDFEGHNRELVIEEDNFEIIETTKPYGFVPTDAKVWFEKFTDDGVEHEYLVTECYIWTGAYPESQRIIEEGNNQSMELSKEKQSGTWTNDYNSGHRIFIYNEALIEKLCILGQQVEPCFEGAQITAFSLNTEEFMRNMYSMMVELQDILNKGGSQETMEEENKTMTAETPVQPEFEKKPEDRGERDKKNPNLKEEEKEKKEYNLEEVAEYAALKVQYTNLQSQYSALQEEYSALTEEVVNLRQFKLTAERQAKQNMIDSFYMLSDEDKRDVIANMDSYSVDDIEARLSVICVRNKVNFNLDIPEKKNETPQGLFNLQGAVECDGVADWVKSVRATAKNN